MIHVATIAAITLIGAALIQLSVSLWFRQSFLAKKPLQLAAEHQQDVAVLMCIRGCDPSLRQSLIGILEQDFGHFTVHLVFDHREDSAWDLVQEIKREHDVNNLMRIHELNSPRSTCGLKCSALLHGIEQMESDAKFLVLLDADVRPHANWLASVIAPLHDDPEVGLVTGNQWFEPGPRANWGSLFRSMWNAGALVPTIVFQNPWAGTLAIRLSDLHAADLPSVWQHSIVDDGPLRKAIQSLGMKIHVAPSLIMINREKCTFSYVNGWVSRMLTWSRLYESTFFLAVVHAVFSNTVMLATFALLAIGLLRADWAVVGMAAGALIVSGMLSVAAYATVRNAAARSAALRGEELPPIGFVRVMKLFWSVAPVQLIYAISSFRALFSRQVRWREITYRLHGKDRVEIVDYHPIAQANKDTGPKVSI